MFIDLLTFIGVNFQFDPESVSPEKGTEFTQNVYSRENLY